MEKNDRAALRTVSSAPNPPTSYVACEVVRLKGHPQFNEKWLQDRIAENPALLGLGELDLKDKERMQPKAGRLDLLLQDTETKRRYEVELQLGATDESHIIRTIEYWDIEKKRYPQYDHCAVLIAEDITSRFLNVINLFNGTIPFVAIQVKALMVDGKTTLFFTKVIDETQRGLVEEDEEVREESNRAYWEEKAAPGTVALADKLLTYVQTFGPSYALKYNKFYIGLAENGLPDNFVLFRPKKETIRVEVRLDHSKEWQAKLEEAEVDLMEYDTRWNHFRFRLSAEDVDRYKTLLIELFEAAHKGV